METVLTIGKLADAAGVNIETIRYYQRRGLLDEPPKPLGGHRRYAPEQAKRVRFIKRAQALGFTLDEVAALLTLDVARACGETQALAGRKLGLIEQKIADLAAMQRVLGELVQQCDVRDGHTTCPIIDVLAKDWAGSWGHARPLQTAYRALFSEFWDDPEQAGLDIQRARADIAAPALDAVVLQDVRDLTDLKVEKTPTFFVNGRPLSSFGHKQLADLVEQEVSKTKKWKRDIQ